MALTSLLILRNLSCMPVNERSMGDHGPLLSYLLLVNDDDYDLIFS